MNNSNQTAFASKDFEALLKALDQTAIVSVTDDKGTISFVNEKFLEVAKYSRTELIGQNHRILKSGHQPQAIFDNLWKTISSGTVWRGELKNRAKDGSYYWVDTSIAPILNSAGKPERYIAVRFLITEKKTIEESIKKQNVELENTKKANLNILEDLKLEEEQTKEKTNALAEAQAIAHVGNWEWGIQKNTVTWSDELYRIFGLTPQSMPLAYDSYLKLVYKDDQENAGKVVGQAMKTHEPFEFDHRTKLANGTIRWIRGRGKVIISEDGAPSKMVGTAQDITDDKEIDKAKTEFVSLASHQLRTPLTTINWYAEMLLAGDAGKLAAVQVKYLKEIYTGNQRMIDLVNALLNVSRIDLGTFSIETEPTNIAELAQSVVEELEPDIFKRKLDVQEQYAQDIPIIQVDPKLMRIVFQNLLSNSVKYTPDGGSITLSIKSDEKNILISVADTGYGIQKDQQNKIFTKLFRADNIKEKDTSGTGLGLYLVKSILEYSGGKIWFESVINKGTTFYVEIPLTGMKAKAGTKQIGG